MESIKVPVELMQLLSAEQIWHYRVIPHGKSPAKTSLWVDVARVSEHRVSEQLIQELELVLNHTVELLPVTSPVIEQALQQFFPLSTPLSTPSTHPKETGGQTLTHSVGGGDAFLWQLIREAKSLRSSDIHIESYQERSRIRIRIDGMLVERYTVDKADYPSLVNQIKISANLDIAEKRLPQDGRIFFQQGEDRFDIRVSVLPTLHGEKIVMRILSQDATRIDIYQLGFEKLDLARYLEGIRRPTGILLISGPTGSGKTTTLYATLKLLNKESRNILTIEDPIEYTLAGINQVQLKENIGLGFAAALRTFLRQDPDVIMVGEIRDTETANMAIRAALTGHLVLSTIHTNSAWGTVSRLVDMGLPPFLIASTLHTTVAQRLIRLLCPHCKQRQAFDPALYPPMYHAPAQVDFHFVSKGCSHCYQTGYKGRKAIYEVIPIDAQLAGLIKASNLQVDSFLHERKISTLAGNAFAFFARGDTSLEEIYPLLYSF